MHLSWYPDIADATLRLPDHMDTLPDLLLDIDRLSLHRSLPIQSSSVCVLGFYD
jgi:hypothetical protein